MRERIRAAIQGSHSSLLNGISGDKATDKIEILFKIELSEILNSFEKANEDRLHPCLDIAVLIEQMREKYELV